jgi:NAD(P)-dependent dehydrogenase (short-subunit alcohol dehydrogenase family)
MDIIDKLFSLSNKVAIVTGASGSIGKAISETLLNAGASVILVDIRKELLIKSTELYKSKRLNAEYFICDVTDKTALTKLVDYTENSHEKIDILVNCAGVTFTHELFDYPDESWETTYLVNLKAPFELSKLVAEVMRKKGSGSIINITSLNSERAFPDNPAYVATKGGLKQLSKSLALDLGKYGIRVNNVGPGIIKADMTMKNWYDKKIREERARKTILGRWGFPKEVAHSVLFLASDASAYITGQDIYVDGGWLCKY